MHNADTSSAVLASSHTQSADDTRQSESELTVSVIIPNYNYGHYIAAAIDSVLTQTYPAHQIIIVDDGSTDTSRNVLATYKSTSGITVIAQENAGQAAALSRGMEEATGDIICFLDSDDMFTESKLERLVKKYRKHEEAQWIFHRLDRCDSEGHIVVPEDRQTRDASKKKTQFVNEQANIRGGDLDYNAPATSGLSFRNAFIAPLFPLPQAHSVYISDHYIKFWTLAKGAGVHLHESLALQRIHGDNHYSAAPSSEAKARIFVNTAIALRKTLPKTKDFCNSLMAEGMRCAHKAGIAEELRPLYLQYRQDIGTVDGLAIQAKLAAKRLLQV